LRGSGKVAFTWRAKGFRFVGLPGVPDSEDAYTQRELDFTELRLMRAWLQSGDSVIDVGANAGIYSFAAADIVGPTGSVLAVEASTALVSRLQEASSLLGTTPLHCENVAVGDEDKEVRFYVAATDGRTSEQSLTPASASADAYVAEVVRMTTLSTLAARLPAFSAPQLVKIDIEGAEMLALRSAPRLWFADDGPLWIAEIHPGALARFGETGQAVAGMFSAESHDRWLLPKYPRQSRFLRPRQLEAGEIFDDALFYNLLAVPRGASLDARRRRLYPFLNRGMR
jgi:FkbM family methyltransferase